MTDGAPRSPGATRECAHGHKKRTVGCVSCVLVWDTEQSPAQPSHSAVALAELLKKWEPYFEKVRTCAAGGPGECHDCTGIACTMLRQLAALSADRPAPPATNTVQCGAHPYRSGVGSDRCLDCGGIGFDSHWGHTRLSATPAPQDREAPR